MTKSWGQGGSGTPEGKAFGGRFIYFVFRIILFSREKEHYDSAHQKGVTDDRVVEELSSEVGGDQGLTHQRKKV